MEERRPVDEFLQGRQCKIIEHADTRKFRNRYLSFAPYNRSAARSRCFERNGAQDDEYPPKCQAHDVALVGGQLVDGAPHLPDRPGPLQRRAVDDAVEALEAEAQAALADATAASSPVAVVVSVDAAPVTDAAAIERKIPNSVEWFISLPELCSDLTSKSIPKHRHCGIPDSGC